MQRRSVYALVAVLFVVIIGLLVIKTGTGTGLQTGATYYDTAIAACKAYPNGSTQNITETSRLTIYLPKNLYPNQGNLLSSKTTSGTATVGWISNAGPIGNSYGASASCSAYYYEFDGTGEVDLTATSSIPGVPQYVVHFAVSPIATTTVPISPPVYSGRTVEGIVVLGPTCPVEHIPPLPQCADKPYQTTVIAYHDTTMFPLASVRSETDGTFTLSLKPGAYMLVAGGTSYYPRCTPVHITVVAGDMQHVTINCDTGIR